MTSPVRETSSHEGYSLIMWCSLTRSIAFSMVRIEIQTSDRAVTCWAWRGRRNPYPLQDFEKKMSGVPACWESGNGEHFSFKYMQTVQVTLTLVLFAVLIELWLSIYILHLFPGGSAMYYKPTTCWMSRDGSLRILSSTCPSWRCRWWQLPLPTKWTFNTGWHGS